MCQLKSLSPLIVLSIQYTCTCDQHASLDVHVLGICLIVSIYTCRFVIHVLVLKYSLYNTNAVECTYELINVTFIIIVCIFKGHW